MINLKELRKCLVEHIKLTTGNYYDFTDNASKRIIIKRKKKMVIENTANGDTKLKRRSVIKIEIIER